MGVFSISSNKKRKTVHKKGFKYKRVQRAERRKQRGGPMTGEIANPELITGHILRKRRTSPRANITLSGKKKRKLMKQLKHMQADKEKLENVMDVELVKPVEKASKPKKEKKAAQVIEEPSPVPKTTDGVAADEDEEWEDVEMSEGDEEEDS